MCLTITDPKFDDIEKLFTKLTECSALLLIQKEKRDELRHRFFRLLAVCHHRHHKKGGHHSTSVHVHVHNSHSSGMMGGGGGGDCCCEYEGSTLPSELTSSHSGLSNIDIYGTSCSAWDSMTGTPMSSDCPPGADLSDKAFSWCAQPWCYVSSACSEGEQSKMFKGARFSYDICSDYHSVDLDDRRKKIKIIVQSAISEGANIVSKLEAELGGTWKVTSDAAVWSAAKTHMWYLVKIPKSETDGEKLLYVYPDSSEK